jgi:preprotein translocase subunit SecA
MNILQKLFDNNEREVAKYQKKVTQINALEPQMQALSDDMLRAKTGDLKERIAKALEEECTRRRQTWEEMDKEDRRLTSDAVLDPLLTEAFAVVRETGRRVLGMRHFDVQLIGGMVTHDGRVGELRTGEGKTLMATLPLYLNALMGKGAHLVTPNDYLSKFGAVSMGPLYNFHGLSVGIIQGASPETGDVGGTYIYDPEYRDPDARYDYARPLARRGEAYACDVTYGTNNEYGFDYLRDNLLHNIDDLNQRELYFAIVDEADSILIDEARTPLIISGPQAVSSDLYVKMDRIVRNLQNERDYDLEEKAKTAMFTEDGLRRVESALGIDNLSDPENLNLMQHANAALRAHAVFKKDIDYVVKRNEAKNKDEIVIVDEFTGRLMFGRRWGDGQHQAIEAKEGVVIENESQTYATITFQNYFRLYSKLSGMTGTAKTEEEELRKVYALDVVTVPTNKPMVRGDHPDIVFKTQEAKLRGITQELLRLYAKQQPVLVGTRNIEASERVSNRLTFQKLEVLAMTLILRDKLENAKLDRQKYSGYSTLLNTNLDQLSLPMLGALAQELRVPNNPRQPDNIQYLKTILDLPTDQNIFLEDALEHGIVHNVLNAKFHEKEAHIIAEAGRKGAVTIATNMAGRGVDIILGGSVLPSDEDEEDEVETADGEEAPLSYRRGVSSASRMQSLLEQESNKDHRERANAVRELGGLFILGTERHESRRIDNQLRGRSGRQGDPGESRFFVAMDDELMRLFGDKSNNPLLSTWSEEQAIDMKLFSGLIEKAQKKVENHNFDARKQVLEYDDVMNTQRDVIYSQRRQVLQGADLRNTMVNYLTEIVAGELGVYAPDPNLQAEWDLEGLFVALNQTFPLVLYMKTADELKGIKLPELEAKLITTANQAYNDKEAHVSSEIMRDLERHWTLMVLDRHWMEHLSNMEYLREGIGWRGMSGTQPIVLYKKEAFDMFQIMLGSLQDEVIRLIFRTHVEIAQAPPQQAIPAQMVRGTVMSDPMTGISNGDESDDGYSILDPVGGEPAAFGEAGYVETGPAQSPNPFDTMVNQPTTSNARSLPRASAAWRSPTSKPAATATATRRVGRNDPCPCGSGKKYKMCCGR